MIADCGHEAKKTNSLTGYGTRKDGTTVCFKCCSKEDRQTMIEEGNSKKLPLYLERIEGKGWEVTNWPGTLRFRVNQLNQGHHNIARTRYDVWFKGPDGHIWHGVQYGEWTQIVHCKRTKEVYTV